VPDSAVGVDGRTVRCAKCRHSWFQEGPEAAAPAVEPIPEGPLPAASTPGEPAEPPRQPAFTAPPAQTASVQPAPTTQAVPLQDSPPAPQPAREAIRVPGRTASPASPVASDEPAATATASDDHARRKSAPVYDDTTAVHYADEGHSSFDFAPPFRPRRNWTRIATFGSVLFAVVTLSLTGAVAWGGLPDWLPIPHQTFSQAQPDLQLDFPRKRQDRKPLPDGTEFFSVSGTISNVGSEARKVPSLLVVLRDKRDRIVYEKEVVPSKRKLAPGEAITVNEALTDIPKAASAAEIGWKPQ